MKDFPNVDQGKTNKLVRKEPESESKVTIKLFIAIVILFLVGLIFVNQRIEYIRTERNVNQLLLKERTLTTEILPLRLEERYLTHLDKIQKIANQDLKLQFPRKSQIIKVEIQKKNQE
jgi:cell division protein FtsL